MNCYIIAALSIDTMINGTVDDIQPIPNRNEINLKGAARAEVT